MNKQRILFTLLIAFFALPVYAEIHQDMSPAAIKERIHPVGQVNVSENGASTETATKTAPPKPQQTADASAGNAGENIYNKHCNVCHAAGVAGAPKKGDAGAWGARAKKGFATLLKHVINGFNAMPPKGTCMECSNKELEAAIKFMCPACKS